MYLSLKGSLGHTPITDRVGEGPLQIAEGAAAAYSLRNLGSDSPSVVRVRRESDNNERDFTAQDISTSVLTNWVNQQITPPLDLRELTATGRDGPIIEAAAAYSLRNLSSSYTGSVVEVRRSTDGALRSFTAAEVTDGTLVAWVNADVDKLDLQAGSLDAFITNETATGFDFSVNSEGSNKFKNLLPTANVSAGNYTVTLDVALNSGSLTGCNLFHTDGSGVSTPLTTGANSLNLTSDAASDIFFYILGTAVADVSITNLTLTQTSADGTVSKWYDQSTTSGVPNANHAVNSDPAEQPRIVINGELYGSGIQIGSTNFLNSQAAFTGFVLNDISSIVLGQASGGNGVGALTYFDGSNNFANPYRYSNTQGYRYSNESVGPQPNGPSIQLFTLIGSPTIAEGFSNGTSYRTSTVSSASVGTRKFRIGGNGSSGISGSIKEAILYKSDQTDNRTALEANIGEVYGIAGIPAYDDSVNGFVETWYDQSGNGNNATQLTASIQPRIVIDGELIMNAKGFPSIAQYRGGAGTNSNRLFEVNSGLPVSNSTHFAVTQYNRQFSYHLIGTSSAGSSRVGRYSSDQFRISQGGTSVTSGAVFPTSVVKLATVNNAASGGTTTGFVDGVQAFSANLADPSSTGLVYKYLFRGDNDGSGPLLYSEFIYYSSDQSANRPAIDANIINHYDI